LQRRELAGDLASENAAAARLNRPQGCASAEPLAQQDTRGRIAEDSFLRPQNRPEFTVSLMNKTLKNPTIFSTDLQNCRF
jgi:hypothetical protein